MICGIVTIKEAAAINGQLKEPYPLKLEIETAIVCALEYPNASGNIRDVHTVINDRIPLVIIPGSTSGSTI